MTVTPSWRAAASSAFSVTGSLGQHDRALGGDGAVHVGVVRALGGGDLQAEVAQRRHVRRDRPRAEVAAARVRDLEVVHAVQQGTEEHDDATGAARRLRVHGVQVEFGRRHDLQVVAVVDPAGADADAAQHLQDPVDLLDTGHPAQRGAARVEERGAQQRHARVLARLDVDASGQAPAADDAEVHGSRVPERDDFTVQGLANPRDHLKADVLVTAFDAVDRALARAERLRELRLGPAPMLPRVADEPADAYEVVVCHEQDGISDMRSTSSRVSGGGEFRRWTGSEGRGRVGRAAVMVVLLVCE